MSTFLWSLQNIKVHSSLVYDICDLDGKKIKKIHNEDLKYYEPLTKLAWLILTIVLAERCFNWIHKKSYFFALKFLFDITERIKQKIIIIIILDIKFA